MILAKLVAKITTKNVVYTICVMCSLEDLVCATIDYRQKFAQCTKLKLVNKLELDNISQLNA